MISSTFFHCASLNGQHIAADFAAVSRASSREEQKNILVMDNSGSMDEKISRDLKRIDQMKHVAQNVVDHLEKNVKLVAFNSRATEISAISTLQSNGLTSFNNALELVYSMVRPPTRGPVVKTRTNVFFLSDGEDNDDFEKHYAGLVTKFRNLNVVFHVIGISKDSDRKQLNRVRALGTGKGLYMFVDQSYDMEKLMELVIFSNDMQKMTIRAAAGTGGNAEQDVWTRFNPAAGCHEAMFQLSAAFSEQDIAAVIAAKLRIGASAEEVAEILKRGPENKTLSIDGAVHTLARSTETETEKMLQLYDHYATVLVTKDNVELLKKLVVGIQTSGPSIEFNGSVVKLQLDADEPARQRLYDSLQQIKANISRHLLVGASDEVRKNMGEEASQRASAGIGHIKTSKHANTLATRVAINAAAAGQVKRELYELDCRSVFTGTSMPSGPGGPCKITTDGKSLECILKDYEDVVCVTASAMVPEHGVSSNMCNLIRVNWDELVSYKTALEQMRANPSRFTFDTAASARPVGGKWPYNILIPVWINETNGRRTMILLQQIMALMFTFNENGFGATQYRGLFFVLEQARWLALKEAADASTTSMLEEFRMLCARVLTNQPEMNRLFDDFVSDKTRRGTTTVQRTNTIEGIYFARDAKISGFPLLIESEKLRRKIQPVSLKEAQGIAALVLFGQEAEASSAAELLSKFGIDDCRTMDDRAVQMHLALLDKYPTLRRLTLAEKKGVYLQALYYRGESSNRAEFVDVPQLAFERCYARFVSDVDTLQAKKPSVSPHGGHAENIVSKSWRRNKFAEVIPAHNCRFPTGYYNFKAGYFLAPEDAAAYKML